MIRNRMILFCSILLMFGFTLDPAIHAQIVYDLPGVRESSIVVADFNHDRIQDLAAVTPCKTYGHGCHEALVSFYTGDGTGHFASTAFVELGGAVTGPAVVADFYGNGNLELIVPGVKKPAPGAGAAFGLAIVDSLGSVSWFRLSSYEFISAVQFADLDGDGKLDMVLSRAESIESYLGDGAGNFTGGSYLGRGSREARLLLGDFNGDGKVDVASPTVSWGVNVFIGNGDGTFQYPICTEGPYYGPMAAADFNHDGKLDLAIGIPGSSRVAVLLGKGDGAFFPELSYDTGQWNSSMVVAGDFDGDGNQDLAVADGCWFKGRPCLTDGAVTILLGNGDGSFQVPTSYNSGGRVEERSGFWKDLFIIAGDLDGNGTIDLIVANQQPSGSYWSCRHQVCHGTLAILLGNGDGTFQSAPVNSHFITSTSLTGNKNPSIYGEPVTFTVTVTSRGPIVPTGTISFQHVRGTATLVDGVATLTTQTIDAGSTNVIATYSGDSSHLASTSKAYQQSVNPAPTTTTVVSSRNPSREGQMVSLTATITSAFAIPQGTVTFTSGNTALGTAHVVHGRAVVRTAALPVGSSTITATYNPAVTRGGGANFIPSVGSMIQVVQ